MIFQCLVVCVTFFIIISALINKITAFFEAVNDKDPQLWKHFFMKHAWLVPPGKPAVHKGNILDNIISKKVKI